MIFVNINITLSTPGYITKTNIHENIISQLSFKTGIKQHNMRDAYPVVPLKPL